MRDTPARVEIVDEWHYWNGFVNGLVRIDGLVFFADTDLDADIEDDEPRQYRARSVFHLLYPLVRFPTTLEGAQADPGIVAFSESEIAAAASVPTPPEDAK